MRRIDLVELKKVLAAVADAMSDEGDSSNIDDRLYSRARIDAVRICEHVITCRWGHEDDYQ